MHSNFLGKYVIITLEAFPLTSRRILTGYKELIFGNVLKVIAVVLHIVLCPPANACVTTTLFGLVLSGFAKGKKFKP